MISNLEKALHWALKLDCPVFRVRPKAEGDKGAKTPIDFNGHLAATTDEATIRRMWTERPDALVGINTGAARIVVADIDMDVDEGKDGWSSIFAAELEDTLIDRTFTYSTRSGGDHFIFADPGTVPLNGTRNHVTPEGIKLMWVDRRAGSSYIIIWGNELPTDRSAFAEPPAWLMTRAVEPEKNPYRGSVEEWLERCPKGEPSPLVQAWVETIPSDFDHVTMVEAQRQLVGWAVEGETGIRWALDRLKSAWLAGQWNTREYQRDFAQSLAGAIKKFGAFPPGPRDIGLNDDFIKHANTIKAAGFLDVWTTLPPSGAKDAMRERVAYIASIALGEGLSMLDAANLSWASAAAREGIRKHLTEDDAKVEVWNVVMEALARPVDGETPSVPDEPEAAPEEAPSKRPVELLSVRERAALANIKSVKWGEQYRWWGDQFMHVMDELNPVMSEAYYRTNRWLILALIFGNKAVLQRPNGRRVILNFYIITLGPSNTGKTEALETAMDIVGLFYGKQDGAHDPDIGGDSTAAGLTQALIRIYQQHGDATSVFHSDEADAILRNWENQQGEFRGMKNRVMELFTGKVPTLQRTMSKDISGVHAEAFFNLHLIGVDQKIVDAIAPDDWISGFVNRIVFAEGEEKYLSDDMLEVDFIDDDGAVSAPEHPPMYVSWVQQFKIIKSTLGRGSMPTRLRVSQAVRERHVKTTKYLQALSCAQGVYAERANPTFRRLDTYVLKCAALVALTEGRTEIRESDYWIALEQVEEWGENALKMMRRTDLSPRARQVNKLAELLRANGGRMMKSDIFRDETYAGDMKYAEGLIKELVAQRRAEVIPAGEGRPEPIVRLLEVVV